MTLGLRARSNLLPVVPANAGTHIPEACGYGFPLARERRRAGGEFALLPLPGGERVGVRGIEAHRETKTPHPTPLPMGEGAERARGECVHAHHLPSAESALAARRRLASSAAVAACARLIQASAPARACGGSCANSESAPAISPRETFASLRARIAAPSFPGVSSMRRMRMSFSAFACSLPSTPSRGAAAACSDGASAENSRASVPAVGTPDAANGSSTETIFASAPSALTRSEEHTSEL